MLIALAAQHGLRLTDLPPPERCARRAMAAKLLLRRRRQRDEAFPKDLFADPAWDMLLDLYAAQQLERPPIAVSSLCIASSEIGRASGRERVCQNVLISVAAVTLK